MAMLGDCGDFSVLNDDLKTIANAVGKNQTRVLENHIQFGRRQNSTLTKAR